MLTIPPILSTITKLLAICEDFCQFMQVCITSLSHPFIPFLFSFLLIFEHCNQLLVRFYHLWKRVFLLISILYKYFFCYANIYRGCSVILWKRNWVHCQILFMNPLHRYIMCLESLAFYIMNQNSSMSYNFWFVIFLNLRNISSNNNTMITLHDRWYWS